jgi:DNA-binding CsgD family transcriptional regulator
MTEPDALLQLVDAVYSAVFDDSAWQAAMEGIVEATGGIGGALAVQDMATHRLQSAVWVGDAASRLGSRYEEHVAAQNVLWQRTASAPVGSVFTDNAVLPGNGVRKFGFFHEVMRPLGIGNVMAAIVHRDGTLSGTATILRAFDRPDFTEDEQRLMRRLGPHLARAMQLRQRLETAELERAAAASALERLGCALLLVDPRGVSVGNPAAERILERGDGLRLRRGALECDDHRDTIALADALRRAAEGEGCGAVLAVSRRSGLRPFSVVVTPLLAVPGWTGPAVMVLVTDPEEAGPPPAEVLQRIYGLTRAEARTAVAIVGADGTKDVAERLGASPATVRTHLQRVFDKTGTHRQSELVRLVLAHGRVREPR